MTDKGNEAEELKALRKKIASQKKMCNFAVYACQTATGDYARWAADKTNWADEQTMKFLSSGCKALETFCSDYYKDVEDKGKD